MGKIVKYLIAFLLVFSTLGVVGSSNSTSAATFNKPVNGVLTSTFGWRSLNGESNYHYGVDWGAAAGTPVYASAGGTVVTAATGYNGGYGNYVIVQHRINGQTYQTLYAHLSSVSVSRNDVVSQGTRVGGVGNTGYSFGNHLHFELHVGTWNSAKSNAVNPLNYIGEDLGGPSGDPSNNPDNGAYARLQVDYVSGYSVNVYDGQGNYKKKMPHGTVFNVYDYSGATDRYNIGADTWIPAEYANVKNFLVHSNYADGYGVNVYTSPNGDYAGRKSSFPYTSWGYRDGHFKLSDGTWIPSEHVIIEIPTFN